MRFAEYRFTGRRVDRGKTLKKINTLLFGNNFKTSQNISTSRVSLEELVTLKPESLVMRNPEGRVGSVS